MKHSFFNSLNHWIGGVSLQGLETACQAATAIKVIEDKHFNGDRIRFDSAKGKTTSDYFQAQLQQQLLIAKKGLIQFRVGSFLKNHQTETSDNGNALQSINTDRLSTNRSDEEALVLEKLAFIEAVISKYRNQSEEVNEAVPLEAVLDPNSSSTTPNRVNELVATSELSPEALHESKYRQQSQRRSFFQNLAEFRKELSPEYERRLVTELRIRRKQDRVAIRWLLLLFIIPLVVQIVAKNLVFIPILNRTFDENSSHYVFRDDLQEKALQKYGLAKELLEAKQLLGLTPEMAPEQERESRKEIVKDLYREVAYEQQKGLANLLADAIALVVFAILAYSRRRQLILIKGLINHTFLQFSDPVKVFIFILITDMFVGFHSAEGWDVVLKGTFEHFGMPENPAAIGLFIAIVPVAIDSCLKFWIFKYLTGTSPASVAILEKMNQ